MTAARLIGENKKEILIEVDDAVVVITPSRNTSLIKEGQLEGKAEDIADRMLEISNLIADTCKCYGHEYTQSN
jgi:hypothetical protein